MSKKYSISDYDKNVSLKPGFGFWLVIVYFIRPFILAISSVQMGRGNKNASVSGLKDMVYPNDFGFFIGVLAALPAVLLVIIYIKRKPGASDSIRKLWRNGANFLTAAAVLNIVILFVPPRMGASFHITTLGWAQLAIAVGIIIFLHTSQRVKDTFADFP